METFKSEEKKRVLPSWMTAPVAEKKAVPSRMPKRRRMAAQLRAATRNPAVKTVYCMNEAEMVDVALGILIEGRRLEKPWEQPPLARAEKPQLLSSSSSSPHTSSPGSSSGKEEEEEEGGEKAPAPGLNPSQSPGTSNSACSSRSPKDSEEEEEEEEEDELKYVREIFFS